MRAAVLRHGQIVVDDIGDVPVLPGHVLLETIACGICGSDLHTRKFGHEMVAAATATNFELFMFDPDTDIVMGHEFSGRVLEIGEGVDNVGVGTDVVAHPVALPGGSLEAVGYSNSLPGAFAQHVLVHASGVIPIPSGVDPRVAALTEPIAVGIHAVDRSRAVEHRSALVLGCGPVGLAVIAALKLRGVPLIVASDFSPTRRLRAKALGAHIVIDPSSAEPIQAWRSGGGAGPTTVFDAVGVPGMIEQAIIAAPAQSEVLVVGLCMQPDTFRPAIAINKELQLTFVLGWTPAEFKLALNAIAEGAIDAGSLITGEVGLDGVAQAFDDLASPQDHVKILVRPNPFA
jgi:2-desacetyl-2-hydroxyethyl bacteriochlorophyllide A dehydrogenase